MKIKWQGFSACLGYDYALKLYMHCLLSVVVDASFAEKQNSPTSLFSSGGKKGYGNMYS